MTWEVEHIGPHTLYRGDCREVLPTLAPVDALLTDIPYGVGMRAFDDNFAIGLEGLALVPCQRGITWISPGKVAAFIKGCLPWEVQRILWMEKLADLSYPWRGWLMNSEAILVLERPGAQWPTPETYHRDCYGVAPWGKTGHPNAKPLSVAKDLLQKITSPGETVIDPFLGSGTTALACLATARRCIGIEREARWFALACQRMHDALAQPDLFLPQAPRAIQQPLFAGGR